LLKLFALQLKVKFFEVISIRRYVIFHRLLFPVNTNGANKIFFLFLEWIVNPCINRSQLNQYTSQFLLIKGAWHCPSAKKFELPKTQQ